MKAKIIYFAFFLVILISYLLIYQAIHVFEHHKPSPCCEHGKCQVSATQKAIILSNHHIPQLKKAIDHCYICEFHYVVVTLPAITHIDGIEKSIHSLYSFFQTDIVAFFSGCNNTQRGPPALLYS
jgi:hypothetical protein